MPPRLQFIVFFFCSLLLLPCGPAYPQDVRDGFPPLLDEEALNDSVIIIDPDESDTSPDNVPILKEPVPDPQESTLDDGLPILGSVPIVGSPKKTRYPKLESVPYIESEKKDGRQRIIWVRQEILRRLNTSFTECLGDALKHAFSQKKRDLKGLTWHLPYQLRNMTTSELDKELTKTQQDYRHMVKGLLPFQIGSAHEEREAKILANTVRMQADSVLKKLRVELPKQVLRSQNPDPDVLASTCNPMLVKAEAIGNLDAAYIEASVANEFYSDMLGVTKIQLDQLGADGPLPANERMWDGRETTYVAYYIHKLVLYIGSLRPERRFLSDIPQDIRKFVLSWDRHFAVREITYLAQRAVLYNLKTGWPIEPGVQRDDLTRLILLNLWEFIQHKVNKADQRLPVFKLWKAEDSRIELAKSLEAKAKHPKFRIAELLSGNFQPTPKEFFLANAHAFQLFQTDSIQSYIDHYLKSGESGVDTGLGTLLRLNNIGVSWEGDDSVEEVQKRLRKVMKDSDRVAKVFLRAAETERPEDLAPDDHKLLKAYGYIVQTTNAKTGESQEMYSLAASRRTLGHLGARRKADLNLPGATVLDVITPKNVALIAAASLVPQNLGPLLASSLEGLVWSERGLVIFRALSQGLVGFYWDALIEGTENYLKKGEFKVNWERRFLDSFLLGAALDISGDSLQQLLRVHARHLRKHSTNRELKKFLESALDQNNKSFQRSLFEGIESGLRLTHDTAISFAFQGILQDEELDSADFLSMLLQGAMAQAYGRGKLSAKQYVASIKKPKLLRDALASNPKLRNEVIKNLEDGKARQDEMVNRFRDAVRQTDESAETHFYKNLGGEFTWKERKSLRSEGEISPELMKKIDALRQDHFDTLVHIARIDAIREINRSFDKYYEHALEGTGDSKKAAELALLRQKHEMDVVMEKPFAPGSKDSTSDVDRATKSVYLRKHLVHIWDVQARRFADGEVPTSAKAFDVNEYINVFPFIKENRKYVQLIKQENFQAEFGANDMSHEQARVAISLSGALRSMSEADMDLYIGNRRKEIWNRVKEGVTKRSELDAFNNRAKWAKQHLMDSRAKLKEIATTVGDGQNPRDPDVMLRAKEKLYNQRMEAIADLQWELSLLHEQEKGMSREALEKRAKIERDLSIAMRDGIETYTNTVGLDIIVNLVQRGTKKIKNAKGEIEEVELKTSDRLDDPNFTIEGDLGEYYSREDIRGVIQDQVMFMAEHVKEFNHGLENEYLTGRALGKYIERYFLIEKVLGMDIAKVRLREATDPTRRLLELSQELALHKNDPEKLLKTLAQASRKFPSSPRNGLAELFYLMEEVVPGMRKMTNVLHPKEKKFLLLDIIAKSTDSVVKEMIAKLMEREKTKQRIIEEASGGEGLMAYLDDELSSIEKELTYLREEQQRLLQLARQYRQTDWEQVIQFENEKAWIITLIHHMPWANRLSKTYNKYQNEKLTKELQLEALEKPSSGSNIDFNKVLTNDPKTPEYGRIKNRIAWLEHKRQRFFKQRDGAKELAANDAKFANLNLSGEWVCGLENDTPATARITQQQDAVTIDLTWTRSNLEGPHVVLKSIHKRGKLMGAWHDQQTNTEPIYSDIKSRPTSLIFEGRVHTNHNELQVTYGPKHHRNSVDWAGMKCRRHQVKTPTDIKFFKLSHGPVPADARMDEKETRGLLAVKVNVPNGKSRSAPFKVYKGRRARSGSGSLWINPGEYRVGATVGHRLVTKKVKVTSRRRTLMTFSPGAIRLEEKSTSGEVSNSHVHVFDLEVGSNSPLWTIYPSHDRIQLLSPGLYKIQVDGATFPWEDEIEIKPGKVTPISVEWATLRAVFDSNASPGDIYLRRAALGDSSEGWMGIGHNVDFGAEGGMDIHLPKGDFELRIVVDGKTLTRRVSVKTGEEKTLTFQP